jgi:hypothetical protein
MLRLGQMRRLGQLLKPSWLSRLGWVESEVRRRTELRPVLDRSKHHAASVVDSEAVTAEEHEGVKGRRGLAERCRGSVTAEFALLLPGLTLLLAVLLSAAAAATAQLKCVDAARSAARLAARHESPSVVLAAARSAGPAGAQARVTSGSGAVVVRVRARVSLPLPGRPALAIGSTAVARLEESAASSGG